MKSLAFLFLPIAFADPARCPPNTLAITGGGGWYDSGTNQDLSYYFAYESPAISVNGVSICRNNSSQCAPLKEIISGLPSGPTLAGSIKLVLPDGDKIETGYYVYRMEVKLKNSEVCILDTPKFHVRALPVYQCNLNEQRCLPDGTGMQTCAVGPKGRYFGPPVACAHGCTKLGYFAECTVVQRPPQGFQNHTGPGPVVPNKPAAEPCRVGTSRCHGTGFQPCMPQVGGGYAFTTVMQCPAGTICAANAKQPSTIDCVYADPKLQAQQNHTVGNFSRSANVTPQGQITFFAPPPQSTTCPVAKAMRCVGDSYQLCAVQPASLPQEKSSLVWGPLVECANGKKCRQNLFRTKCV